MAAKWWPEALLYIVDPNGLEFRIWGSTCYAHVPKTKRKDAKLGERAIEFKVLGFSSKYKGYRLKANKYLIARDVKFSTTVTDAMIRRSFPIENYTNDLEEEMVIQNLGKRSRGNIEVEVPTQGEDMSSESVIRSPTSQSVGVTNGDGISPEPVTRPSTS
ncbi:putative Retroelement pol Polyprotein [Phytophthora megakarya]|uniref:Putative Retroelement pol Polyprotein n=1 Tax=Phytophthora megakarya TaxID=4795 RepID=A0A225VQF8_9STRA|nr:putative Retroelement pol Polyprotein [Phytophthora megakarya]